MDGSQRKIEALVVGVVSSNARKTGQSTFWRFVPPMIRTPAAAGPKPAFSTLPQRENGCLAPSRQQLQLANLEPTLFR